MKSFETWKTWLIIVGLLLFGALASVLVPSVMENSTLDLGLSGTGPRFGGEREPDTVPLPGWLPGATLLGGEELAAHPLIILAILTALILGLLIGGGLALGFPLRLLDRQTRALKEEPGYLESLAVLETQQKEQTRALKENRPPTEIPDHEESRWATVSTALVILFFVMLVGFALADTLYEGAGAEQIGRSLVNPALPFAGAMTVATLLILVLILVGRRGQGWRLSDDAPMTWNTIWVVVTGLIFLGIGIGLTIAMYSVEAFVP